MIYPTIAELTKDEFNRYELALATAKCARKLTDEYVKQCEMAEKTATGNKDVDRNLMNAINKEYRDEKAVKNAINRIYKGEYVIVRKAEEDTDTAVAEDNVTEDTVSDAETTEAPIAEQAE